MASLLLFSYLATSTWGMKLFGISRSYSWLLTSIVPLSVNLTPPLISQDKAAQLWLDAGLTAVTVAGIQPQLARHPATAGPVSWHLDLCQDLLTFWLQRRDKYRVVSLSIAAVTGELERNVFSFSADLWFCVTIPRFNWGKYLFIYRYSSLVVIHCQQYSI